MDGSDQELVRSVTNYPLERIMEIPEHLRELIDRLGQALVEALATDDQCRDLARQIQSDGYDIGLMVEATLALHRREEGEASTPGESEQSEIISLLRLEPADHEGPRWSDDDRAFLKKFKISLD